MILEEALIGHLSVISQQRKLVFREAGDWRGWGERERERESGREERDRYRCVERDRERRNKLRDDFPVL